MGAPAAEENGNGDRAPLLKMPASSSRCALDVAALLCQGVIAALPPLIAFADALRPRACSELIYQPDYWRYRLSD